MGAREWMIAACVLGLSCGPAEEATGVCGGHGVVLGEVPLRWEVDLVADCVVVRSGSRVAIPEGATTVVRARTLVIEGEATIAGAGSPRQPQPGWTSGGADCVFAHANWAEAVRMSMSHEELVPGRTGGTLVLRYGRIEGGAARLGLLHFEVAGGAGAPGRELRCGCARPEHAAHVTRGPTGPQGESGTWRFIEEAQ